MPDLPYGRLADLRAASQLLQSGAYEHAADMLQNAQSAAEATGNPLEVVPIAAVREICLACLQCQAEAEWHRQAGQTAEQRQEQLHNYAQAMLDRISAQAPAAESAHAPIAEPHPTEAPEGAQPPRLSLNVRNLMQRAKQLFVPERTTTATPPPEESEGPFSPEGEGGEAPGLHVEEEEARAEPTPWAGMVEPEAPAAAAPPSESAAITLFTTEAEEEELEQALPPGIGEPAVLTAPPGGPAEITPLGTVVEEEQPEPVLPPGMGEREALIFTAPPGEPAEITPPCTEEEAEEPEPAVPAGIGEPEAPVVSAPPSELPDIPLEAEVKEEELEPAVPAGIGEPEAPPVSVRPAAVQRAPESYTMAIYCFGSFRVYQHDQPIEEWSGLRGQAVLKYLVAHHGTPTAKDVLMDVFWPDADPEAARRNLHQAIYSLRQTLRRRDPGIQHIQFENNQYLLNPALSVWIDVEEFQTHVQAGRRLEAAGQQTAAMVDYAIAEGLYQGDFLEDNLYDDWPRAQRERLRTVYLDIADRLSEYDRQEGDYAAAIAVCQKVLTVDNCVEEAHRRLMRCYVAQGRRHLAVRQYHACVEALAKELDVSPSDETRELYASISATP